MTERKEKMAHVSEYVPPEVRQFVGKRIAVKLHTGTATRVEQCHQENTNINKIVARYRRSGGLPEAPEGNYGDTTDVGEYYDVVTKLREARESFENLPSQIKDSFATPEEFMEYVSQQESNANIRAENAAKDRANQKAAKSDVPPPDKPSAPAEGLAEPES